MEIGIGPSIVLLLGLATTGQRPAARRVLVSLGIVGGCGALALAALGGSGFASFGASAWAGLAASAAARVGATLITLSSRALLDWGWRFGAVLAHRFTLIVPVAFVLALGEDPASIGWTPGLVALPLLVAVIGVLAPLTLLQIGIARCEPHAVMATVAWLPVPTFAAEGLSPAYAGS